MDYKLLREFVKEAEAKRDMPPFLKQNRPAKAKEVYRALKRDHPTMDAGKKARIANAMAKKAGAVTINYGIFVNTLISFFAIAWVAFGFVKLINRIKRNNELDKETRESSTKVCHYCLSVVPVGASRCSHCTADI